MSRGIRVREPLHFGRVGGDKRSGLGRRAGESPKNNADQKCKQLHNNELGVFRQRFKANVYLELSSLYMAQNGLTARLQ